MGIKNLNKFLKEVVPEAFIEIPISAFSGQRLAVDTLQWFHANISVATKEVVEKIDVVGEENPSRLKIFGILMRNFFAKIKQLLKNRIIPVFIFDGTSPIEKEKTKEDRKKSRTDRQYKITEIRNTLQNLPLERRPDDLLQQLRTLVGQDIYFSEFEIGGIKEILYNIGLPFIQAKGEAEQTGAALCREGYSFGLWTTDTDSLAHGCPIQIREITQSQVNPKTGVKEPFLAITSLPIVLQKLGFSFEMWQDYCIACGTDYNPNMPNNSSKRCYDLIAQHRRIERFPTNLPTHILNHYRGRQLFSLCSSSVCVEGWNETSLAVFPDRIEQARNVFDNYELGDHLTSLYDFLFQNGIFFRDPNGVIQNGIKVDMLGETRYSSDGEPYLLVAPLSFSLSSSPIPFSGSSSPIRVTPSVALLNISSPSASPPFQEGSRTGITLNLTSPLTGSQTISQNPQLAAIQNSAQNLTLNDDQGFGQSKNGTLSFKLN